jgi:hypothetical protein
MYPSVPLETVGPTEPVIIATGEYFTPHPSAMGEYFTPHPSAMGEYFTPKPSAIGQLQPLTNVQKQLLWAAALGGLAAFVAYQKPRPWTPALVGGIAAFGVWWGSTL